MIYLAVGMITGIVNTLAGGGTIFVFSTLIFLGMPAGIANGTNRLGVLIQNLTGVITFFRSGLLDLKSTAQYVLPTVIGSVLGALVVTDLPAQTLNVIVGMVMLGLLYPILDKPRPAMSRKIGNMRPSIRFAIFWY